MCSSDARYAILHALLARLSASQSAWGRQDLWNLTLTMRIKVEHVPLCLADGALAVKAAPVAQAFQRGVARLEVGCPAPDLPAGLQQLLMPAHAVQVSCPVCGQEGALR